MLTLPHTLTASAWVLFTTPYAALPPRCKEVIQRIPGQGATLPNGGGWNRTTDLKVMSLASFQTAPLRYGQNILAGCSVACQAEGQGFEPWVHRYYARRFSKPVHSASLSTFRSGRRTRASMNVTRPRQALCEQSTAAPSTGFEPVAFPLGGERSIPLSYEGFIALSVSKNPRLQ